MTGPGRGRGRPPQAQRRRQNNEDGASSRPRRTRRRQSPNPERRVQRRRESVLTVAQARHLMANIRRVLAAYRPAIIRRNYDCDCNTDSHTRTGSFCGAPFIGPGTGRTLRIHYHEWSAKEERRDALIAAMSDEQENPEG